MIEIFIVWSFVASLAAIYYAFSGSSECCVKHNFGRRGDSTWVIKPDRNTAPKYSRVLVYEKYRVKCSRCGKKKQRTKETEITEDALTLKDKGDIELLRKALPNGDKL